MDWYGPCILCHMARLNAGPGRLVMQDARVDAVAGEIRRYLDAHPDAADTVDGVLQWWLSRASASASHETVEHALDVLVAAGEIVRRSHADGTVIYTRHR